MSDLHCVTDRQIDIAMACFILGGMGLGYLIGYAVRAWRGAAPHIEKMWQAEVRLAQRKLELLEQSEQEQQDAKRREP